MKCRCLLMTLTGTESSTNTIHLSIAEFVFISRPECLWDAPWFIQTNAVVRERRRCNIVITRFSFQGDTDTLSTLIIHKLSNQSSGDRTETAPRESFVLQWAVWPCHYSEFKFILVPGQFSCSPDKEGPVSTINVHVLRGNCKILSLVTTLL